MCECHILCVRVHRAVSAHVGDSTAGRQVSAQRCVTFATYTFHAHLSPEQARLCGVDSAWAFYPRPTYCVVRDPFSRFLSLFIFVQYHAHIWPARRCWVVSVALAAVSSALFSANSAW